MVKCNDCSARFEPGTDGATKIRCAKHAQATREANRRRYERDGARIRPKRNAARNATSTHRDSVRKWRQDNPDRAAAHRLLYKARKWGVTPCELVLPSTIYARDGWWCYLCQQPIDPDVEYPNPLYKSLDHVVPLVRGGPHVPSNLRPAHLVCNRRKWMAVLSEEHAQASALE